jgi:hypothetical protein
MIQEAPFADVGGPAGASAGRCLAKCLQTPAPTH